MGKPIDINHAAVWKAIEKYKVGDQIECFEKVLMLNKHFMDEANE